MRSFWSFYSFQKFSKVFQVFKTLQVFALLEISIFLQICNLPKLPTANSIPPQHSHSLALPARVKLQPGELSAWREREWLQVERVASGEAAKWRLASSLDLLA